MRIIVEVDDDQWLSAKDVVRDALMKLADQTFRVDVACLAQELVASIKG